MAILRNGASDAVRAAAADRLAALVALHHVRNQDVAAAAGAVTTLGALVEKSARSATRTAAATCLASLVRDHPPSMEAARDGGIIESVVSMLRSSRHEDETEAALEAAAWLAKGNRVNQVMLRAASYRDRRPQSSARSHSRPRPCSHPRPASTRLINVHAPNPTLADGVCQGRCPQYRRCGADGESYA